MSDVAPKSQSAKVLRLGVIHAGKIVEERLLRKRAPVAIGEAAKNTIVVPSTARVGPSFKLFDLDGEDYELAFTDHMQGRVSIDDVPVDFQTLRAQGIAKRRGDAYVMPLADRAKGKIVLGDVTILFQFVVPPAEPKKITLPRHIRSSLLYSVDWYFNLYIAITTLIFGVFVLYLGTIPIPEEVDFDQISDKFAKMIMPTLDRSEQKPPEDKNKAADKPKDEEKKPEKKPEKKSEDSDSEPAMARRKEIQKQVQGKGVLAILGVKGQQKGALADVFGEGKAVAGDIDSAFQGIGGIEVANGANTTRRGGGGSGESSQIGALQTSGSGKVGLGEKTEAHVGNVKSEAPEVDGGSLDPGAIARVVKTRLSAIKECYERELKRDPKLSGKVVVRFTVDEDGRVTNATVEDNSTGSKAVGSCIVERFERFRFPKPDGGSITVSYPFIFTPSS